MNSLVYLLPVVWTVYPGRSWITLQSETMDILCQVAFSREGIAAAVVVSWSTPSKYLRLMKLDLKVPTDTLLFLCRFFHNPCNGTKLLYVLFLCTLS
uniref:Uncharacterized protein n=1 Tax=Anguilla anguilla TaxID=7936 RepID=A0A0E9XJW1_ANGAN